MLIQPAGPMGRFLFPALPAFALLVVAGWYDGLGDILSGAGGVGNGVIISGMGALALLALGRYLWPAVGYPPRVSRRDMAAFTDLHRGQRRDLQFGDVARVLATEVRPSVVRPGDLVYVTVVWEPLQRTDRPYNVYVHLIDEAEVLIAQRDTWPGLGRAPTTAWRVGHPFVDVYRVELLPTAYTPNAARVRVGLYEPEQGRLPVYQPGYAEAIGDGIEIGMVTVPPVAGRWPNAQYTNFGDEIALVGYTLEPRKLSPGETFSLTLYWQPLEPHHPYGVFAQVLDADYKVWGSMDSGGPSWEVGGVITETRRITLLPDTPQGSYPVQVGLQHSAIGRLPVIAQDGQHVDSRVLLGSIQVQE
jgi:hypothetical protein